MKRSALSVALATAVAAAAIIVTPAASPATASPSTPAGIDLLAEVQIAPEQRDGYNRDLFEHWIDEDRDGCNTRAEVLKRDSLSPYTVYDDCAVQTGGWHSIYDEQSREQASDVSIDHLVPLAEAWDSGASAWSPERRRAYANDLGFRGSLVVMTDSYHQSKSDRDFAEFQPAFELCRYAQDYTAVKWRWDLTIDQAESNALRAVLESPACYHQPLNYLVEKAAGNTTQPRWPLYITRYDGTIYELVDYVTPKALSYERWAGFYGAQAPWNASTDYVKYPWSPSIYAVTFWPGGEDYWQWEHIQYPEWQRAGFPSARNAGWIKDSYYYQWATSGEIFVSGPDDRAHKLTYSQWRDSGFRQFEVLADRGLQKLSWTNDIAYMESISAGQGGPLSYSDWSEMSFPTPQVVQRFAGDQFYRYGGSADIWYAGPTMNRTINYNEWRAAGFPQPTLIGSDPTPPVVTPPVTQPPADVYYANCSAVPRHLKPVLRGQPGYGSHLDRDGDGRACEV